MIDSTADFEACFPDEQGPGPYEGRFDDLIEPLMETRNGLVFREFDENGQLQEGHEGGRKVDLVVWASVRSVSKPHFSLWPILTPPLLQLFWDEHFLEWHRTQLSPEQSPPASQLGYTYPELSWHRSRLRGFVHHLRSRFGADTPLMLRTRQFRKRDKDHGQLKIFQLDQSARSVAREEGVREFGWGEKLEGYGE